MILKVITTTSLKFISRYMEKILTKRNIMMRGIVQGTVLSGNTLTTTWGNSIRVIIMMKYILSKVIGLK